MQYAPSVCIETIIFICSKDEDYQEFMFAYTFSSENLTEMINATIDQINESGLLGWYRHISRNCALTMNLFSFRAEGRIFPSGICVYLSI